MTIDEAQVSSEPTLPEHFVRWWMFRTIVGCLTGVVVVFIPFIGIIIIGNALKFSNGFMQLLLTIWLIAAIPIYGGFIGYIQWEERLLGFLPRRKWIIAGAISLITGIISGLLIVGYGPALFSETVGFNREMDGYGRSTLAVTWWITVIIWSVIMGVGSGAPSWIILKRNGYAPSPFITATIIGFIGLFLVAILLGSVWDYSTSLTSVFLCVSPLFLGAATGISLRRILRSKPPS